MFIRSLATIALIALSGCRPITQGADLPPTRPASPLTPAPPPAAPAAGPDDAPRDPAVNRASTLSAPPSGAMSLPTTEAADPSRAKAESTPITAEFTGMSVARVGNEEITLAELRYAMAAIRREQGGNDAALSKADRVRRDYQLGADLLKQMIDQKLIIQEAKRMIGGKDGKKWDQFVKYVDKQFAEMKLPNLLKRHDAVDEAELRRKLEETGQSLDEIRKTFRNDLITQQFLFQTIGRKVHPELPEMEAYYHAHLKDFQTPSQVSFREIVVKFDSEAGRAEARKKAEVVLARLRRGESFDAVAKAESQGATAAKGGLWEKVQPGGFSPEVNAAVDRLPIRQLSPIIEGPNALRIVRVELRRKAGPLSFEEAQKDVNDKLSRELTTVAIEKLLARLRSKTFVSNKFEDDRVEPAAVRQVSARPEEARP